MREASATATASPGRGARGVAGDRGPRGEVGPRDERVPEDEEREREPDRGRDHEPARERRDLARDAGECAGDAHEPSPRGAVERERDGPVRGLPWHGERFEEHAPRARRGSA